MARPRKEEKYIHKTFKLPRELSERLDGYVERITANRSLIVRIAILEYLNTHAPKESAVNPQTNKQSISHRRAPKVRHD